MTVLHCTVIICAYRRAIATALLRAHNDMNSKVVTPHMCSIQYVIVAVYAVAIAGTMEQNSNIDNMMVHCGERLCFHTS
jgi:hypothetical protein